MTQDERDRRSEAAKVSPSMRRSKRGITHGNPELTRRILESMAAEIDKLNPGRLNQKKKSD